MINRSNYRWNTLLCITIAFNCHAGDVGPQPVPISNEIAAFSTNRHGMMAKALFTTDAYRQEALRLLIQEANQAAAELQLPEKLPITESNLTQKFIITYGMARMMNQVGNVATSNYLYFVATSNKFCHVVGTHADEDCVRLAAEYSGRSWHPTEADTNEAWQLASNWLAATSMDVQALDKECYRKIFPMKLSGQGTNSCYMPDFWVSWTKEPEGGHGSAAYVELFLPTKKLMQLDVIDSKYNHRKPLEFPNIRALIASPQK